ncbi:hypothetical protein ES703_111596 [subsurface metagenome]
MLRIPHCPIYTVTRSSIANDGAGTTQNAFDGIYVQGNQISYELGNALVFQSSPKGSDVQPFYCTCQGMEIRFTKVCLDICIPHLIVSITVLNNTGVSDAIPGTAASLRKHLGIWHCPSDAVTGSGVANNCASTIQDVQQASNAKVTYIGQDVIKVCFSKVCFGTGIPHLIVSITVLDNTGISNTIPYTATTPRKHFGILHRPTCTVI